MNMTQLTAIPKAWGDQLARQIAGLSYVISGLAVTPQGVASRQVNIAAGTGWVNGVFVSYAGGNVTPAAPAAQARIDLVRIASGAAVPSVVLGVESAAPVEPALAAGDLLLATVFTPFGAVDYTSGGYVNDYTMPGPTMLSVGTTPATAGAIRLPNNTSIRGRDSGNTFNEILLQYNSSNVLQLGGSGGAVGGLILGSSTMTYQGSIFEVGTTPATAGTIRIPNQGPITARNAANSANVEAAQIFSDNTLLLLGGNAVVGTGFISVPGGGTVATTGIIRIASQTSLTSRNVANNANMALINLNVNDALALFDSVQAAAVQSRTKAADGTGHVGAGDKVWTNY